MAKTTQYEGENSYFDGGFWGLLGYNLLTGFVTAITFGIAFPWMYCVKQRWIARHTVVCGRRMRFDGTGGSLIGHYLLWVLLTVVTLGIYGFWMGIALKKWITKNTHYQGEPDNNSYFDGGVGGYIGINLLCFLLTACTLGIGAPWAAVKRLEWEARHTVIDSQRHIFVGTGGSLFLKRLLWGFLTGITLGIFGLWIPIKMQKWTVGNTIDNEHTTEALIRRSEYRAGIQTMAANLHTYRVQDEMELIQNGITAATEESALLAMAQAGCRSAQFEYVRRYAGGNVTTEPFAALLKASARQGYAPAMCLYAQSGGENVWELMAGAASHGQLDAVLYVMRGSANAGLAAPEDDSAVSTLEEAVRWYDVQAAGEGGSTPEDDATDTRCRMKLRRIRTKTPPKHMSVGKGIGIAALILAGILVLTLLIGAVLAYFVPVQLKPQPVDPALGSSLEENAVMDGSSGLLGGLFGNATDRFSEDAAVSPGISQEYEQPYQEASSELDIMTFLNSFRTAMENDPNYYTVSSIAAGPGEEIFALECSHYYWVSYFEMHVYTQDAKVTRIVLTGPRVYETIDENINGLEFQSISRVLYMVLGIGELMDITPAIDAGMDYTDSYPGWNFHYTMTEDTLTLDIQPA